MTVRDAVLPLVLFSVSATAAVGLGASDPQITQPPTSYTVARAKLVKAVDARNEARAEAKRWKRVALHTPSVQEALTVASVAYDVPRSELSSVAWCESRHTPTARNGRYRGIFQFGPIFESSPYGRAGLSVWSPLASAMAAAYIVRHGGSGWSPWECAPRGAFRP